ncbi:VWA domain-containing protein [Bacillus tianshenii]|nr:VWA domain-containing protein [Bacillus tianshenii]
MFVLIILALAGFHTLLPIDHTSTVFVVDRSSSVNEQEAVQFVNDAMQVMEKDDEAGVVLVGKQSVIEKPLTTQKSPLQQFTGDINKNYTNLASGLQLASGMLSNEKRGKVVLLTDGNENIGDVRKQVKVLKQQGIPVDVKAMNASSPDDVLLTDFSVPQEANLGEKVMMKLRVKSTYETNATLTIYENEQSIAEQAIRIQEGVQSFSLPHVITKSGFRTYRAELTAEADMVIQNNEAEAFLYAKGVPKILVVEGEKKAAVNLTSALQASNADVDVIQPALLPSELSGYLNYQSIIFANVSAPDVPEGKMTLIKQAVQHFGRGFVMTGGEQSFGLGGYVKTPIEEILPVKMDLEGKKKIPPVGLAIVLDKSGSMEGQKIRLAREAAARSVELLREEDIVHVTAFDGEVMEVIPSQQASEKAEIAKKIRSIPAGGGTSIYPALELAVSRLEALDVKRKHLILLTDGQSSQDGNYGLLIEQAREQGITLSTVALGRDADLNLLESLADSGGGRFYDVLDESTIPSIFSRETMLMTRTFIQDNPFYPRLVHGYEWQATLGKALPQMNAYIATTPKARAQQILLSEEKDPVLMRWQYGLGRTVAWTSDVSGKWAGSWVNWSHWGAFSNELVKWTFPSYENSSVFMTKEQDGQAVSVHLEKPNDLFSAVDVSIISGEGNEVEHQLRRTSPNETTVRFNAAKPGVYYLQMQETEGEGKASSFQTGIVVPYSQEYNLETKDQQLLKDIATISNGTMIESAKEWDASANVPVRWQKASLFWFLLLIALFLFMIDVAVRRFQFPFHLFRRFKGKASSKQSTPTVKSSPSPRRERLERKPAKKEQAEQQPPSNQHNDRMKRLLEAKERRRK